MCPAGFSGPRPRTSTIPARCRRPIAASVESVADLPAWRGVEG